MNALYERKSPYMKSNQRKEYILNATMELATRYSYLTVTRDQISTEAKVSPGLVSLYFDNMDELREKIISTAIETGNIKIIIEAIVHRHRRALRYRGKFKEEIIKYLFPS